jgi:hypothetical protein
MQYIVKIVHIKPHENVEMDRGDDGNGKSSGYIMNMRLIGMKGDDLDEGFEQY